MTNHNKIWDEKLLHDINKEAAKISAKSSGRIDKYKYLQVKKDCLLVKY